jgi:Transport protein Avl9
VLLTNLDICYVRCCDQLQVDCKEQLELFHSSVIHTNFNELGHALLYSDLPVTPLLLQLNGHIMSLLRLVLLEGRILLYSRSCAVVSTAVYALAMLLPGCLPLGFSSTSNTTARTGASPRTVAATTATAATGVHPAFSARAYRWRKYGLPLQTFYSSTSSTSSSTNSSGGGCRLEPLLVMAEAAAVLACSGFLAGTTNAMISSMPSAALDCFVNLDDGTVRTARTPLAKAAFTPGADDRAFVQSLVAATRASTAHTADTATTADANSSTSSASGSSKGLKIHKHSGSVDWEGSGPWAADQIQLFFEEMLVRTAAALAQAQQQADSSNCSSGSSAAAASKAGTNGSTTTASTSSSRRANSSGSGWGFDAMLSTAAWLTGTATTAATAAATNDSSSSSSSNNDALVQAALAEYGRDWTAHWLRTHNYKHWCSVQNVPQEELAARPRHKRVLASIGSSSNSAGSSDAVDSPKKQQPCPQSGCNTYSYPTGDVYIGEFVKGRREGRGHYVEHSTGNTYEGEWRR